MPGFHHLKIASGTLAGLVRDGATSRDTSDHAASLTIMT